YNMKKRIKKLWATCAVFVTSALLLNVFAPYRMYVKAAGTTEIRDQDIINVKASQDGYSFSGELDYHIPSTIKADSGIVTYDFSKVKAFAKDADGNYETNGVSALDFSRFTLEGPIIIENSIYNSEFENEINTFKNTKDPSVLRDAGYPYWYSFDKNGVVSLDYSAIFTENAAGQRDYDILYDKSTSSFSALSYVVFSCELNKEAFHEAGGDYILSFITDPITSPLNPHVHVDPPKTLDKDIEVTKACTSFDFDNAIVKYTISVKNNGKNAITSPIELKDSLDDGLAFVSVDTFDAAYVDPASSKNTSSLQFFSINGLPSGETTTITYTCRIRSAFYYKNQNAEFSNAGNTITATSVPDGGDTPVPVILNERGDLSIRVVPPNVNYEKIGKSGRYTNGQYDWSITLNNGTGTLHSDLRDVILRDRITYNEANDPQIVDGKVTITNASDSSLSHTVTGVTIDSFGDPGIKLEASWFDKADSDGIYIGEPKDRYIVSYATSTGNDLSSLTTDQKV
ncbi:MAG: hypothetical protein J6T47_05785, partial [Lachnospiraceae bacterium]|nr:hypothetical protein [Lachnospiraceae bacterium]